jgi:hypothetical protein
MAFLESLSLFGVYEVIVSRIWPKKPSVPEKQRPILTADLKILWMTSSINQYVQDNTPIAAHFIAGALSGVAQSMILDTWEIVSYWWHHRRHNTTLHQHVRVGIHHRFLLRRLVHHAVGFSILFGCYESVRRTIVYAIYEYFGSGRASVPTVLQRLERYNLVRKDSDGCLDMTIVPLSISQEGWPGAHILP